jgi:hypothetical protein
MQGVGGEDVLSYLVLRAAGNAADSVNPESPLGFQILLIQKEKDPFQVIWQFTQQVA